MIESNLTLDEALSNKEIPEEIKKSLVIIDIDHLSFDGKVHRGQLVVHQKIAAEIREIFQKILELKFPIEKIIPIVKYNWSDEDSMADNNTSAFNYRFIYGKDKLSNHSFGCAIDINPALNPYILADGTVFPPKAMYDPNIRGSLVKESAVVSLFTERGWIWGGNWDNKEAIDWQHFEKNIF